MNKIIFHIDIFKPKVLEVLSIMMATCPKTHDRTPRQCCPGRRCGDDGNALFPPSPFGGFGWSCGCLLDDQSAASLMSLLLRALHSIQNFHDLLFDDFSGFTGVWN